MVMVMVMKVVVLSVDDKNRPRFVQTTSKYFLTQLVFFAITAEDPRKQRTTCSLRAIRATPRRLKTHPHMCSALFSALVVASAAGQRCSLLRPPRQVLESPWSCPRSRLPNWAKGAQR